VLVDMADIFLVDHLVVDAAGFLKNARVEVCFVENVCIFLLRPWPLDCLNLNSVELLCVFQS